MTERFLRVTAVIGVLVVPLTSCSSESARKQADRDSLRAEVMTLVEQSPERRQANVCEAMARNDRFDGTDDPQRTACATWTELTPTEIGRASSRDREEISVGAVSLNE